MELFGQEINIHFNKKQTKTLIFTGFVIGVFVLIFIFMISPMLSILSKKNEVSQLEEIKIQTDQNLKSFEKKI